MNEELIKKIGRLEDKKISHLNKVNGEWRVVNSSYCAPITKDDKSIRRWDYKFFTCAKRTDTVCSLIHCSLFTPRKRFAFTLAEVLITLGVIGVVAALTIPTLIQNHRKSVALNSLKKSFSIMSQAIKLAEAEHGSLENIEAPTETWNASSLEDWWNKYFEKYFNGTKHFKNDNQWFIVNFNDGSGIGLKSNSTGHIDMHVIHCVNLNKCMDNEFKKIEAQQGAYSDGKNSFVFLFNDENGYLPEGINNTRDTLKNHYYKGCGTENNSAGHRYCATLIMQDGWQIKDDYPVKF